MNQNYHQCENHTPEEEIKVGIYGTRWLEFMQNNHPKIVKQLRKSQTLQEVARSVDKYAQDYKTLLDRQYERLHPRPWEYDYEEVRKWEFTRNFYTDGTVMRERVLIPYKTA